jgi:hypothetical protein
VTSSTAAIQRVESKPLVFTEADWGNQAVEEVEKLEQDAGNGSKYRASKTLAEKGLSSSVVNS